MGVAWPGEGQNRGERQCYQHGSFLQGRGCNTGAGLGAGQRENTGTEWAGERGKPLELDWVQDRGKIQEIECVQDRGKTQELQWVGDRGKTQEPESVGDRGKTQEPEWGSGCRTDGKQKESDRRRTSRRQGGNAKAENRQGLKIGKTVHK